MKTFTANRGRYEIIVDDEDYDVVMELPRIKEGTENHHLKWTVTGEKGKERVRTGPPNGPFIYLHHSIMCPSKGECVIFLTENRLDYRKQNLKVVPGWSVRLGQKRKHKSSFSSKYRGVRKYGNGWAVSISRNSTNCHLGFYLDELHAARAYDIKAKELHGEFAILNNVSEDIVPIKYVKKKQETSSKYVGVYLNKRVGLYWSQIRVKGERTFLGTYIKEIHAARAFDIAVKKYRGPDAANNNVPESVVPVRGRQRRAKKV